LTAVSFLGILGFFKAHEYDILAHSLISKSRADLLYKSKSFLKVLIQFKSLKQRGFLD